VARISSAIWERPGFGTVSVGARLTFLGLVTLADGQGKAKGHPRLIRSQLFWSDDLPLDMVEGWLCELAESELIERAREARHTVIYIRAWREVRGKRTAPLPRRVRDFVRKRDGGICQLCGEPIPSGDMHVDHIRPVALGGTDHVSNLQASHSRCNLRKGARA
jgi:hypothetical protein